MRFKGIALLCAAAFASSGVAVSTASAAGSPMAVVAKKKKKKKKCHPSYKGACLKPNASDYDCAGGSGNGPYYVSGPIRVVGSDPYDLDRDGDGYACE